MNHNPLPALIQEFLVKVSKLWLCATDKQLCNWQPAETVQLQYIYEAKILYIV